MENNQNPNEKTEMKVVISELEITLERLDSTDLASIAGGYESASYTTACCCCCCCTGCCSCC
jgi:hypothetical protein